MRIEVALMFILVINVLLFMSQVSVTNIAIEAGVPSPVFYDYQGSTLSKYDKGDFTLEENPLEILPEAQQSGGVLETVITAITDMFTTFVNWLKSIPGLNYVFAIVGAVPNMLKTLGMPVEYAFALGAMWHAFTVFLIVAWVKGN